MFIKFILAWELSVKKNAYTKFHENATTGLRVDTTSRTGGRSFHVQYPPPTRNKRPIILGFKHFLLLQKMWISSRNYSILMKFNFSFSW